MRKEIIVILKNQKGGLRTRGAVGLPSRGEIKAGRACEGWPVQVGICESAGKDRKGRWQYAQYGDVQ